MLLRLEDAEQRAQDLGFPTARATADELAITVLPGVVLVYYRGAELNEMIAFEGSDWHSHETVSMQLDDGSYACFDELDLLTALSAGEMLIVTLLVDDKPWQRWLQHRREPLPDAHDG